MGQPAPQVGRAAERVLLQEQLAAAQGSHGRLVIIGGEAGIGKSATARDLVSNAQASGFRVLLGHSYDLAADSPYGLWLDMGENYQRSESGSPAPSLPTVLTSGGLQGISTQAELFTQVQDFLWALAAGGPVLVVLEDLHWSDPASLELLRHVSAHLDGARMLLVMTYRVDELTRMNPLYQQLPALIHASEGLRLDLRRLGRADFRELVELRYALSDEDAEVLVSYLMAHSEGNPFFAIELLHTLEAQENGGLTRTAHGWKVEGIGDLIVPTLVRQVIDSRVARLGESTRAPLAIAAVIGQDVALDLWSDVSGVGEFELLQIVDQAVECSLFHASPDGTRVHFVHALTRAALYEGISPPRRRLIHRRVAEALMARDPHNPDPVAYHFRQAGDPAAPEWLMAAGERAQRAYAWLSARDRFMAAADLLVDIPSQQLTRARLLYRCSRLQRYSDAANEIDNLRIAARLAGSAGEKVLAAEAVYSRGLLHCFADDWENGVNEMSAGIAEMEALSPEEGRVGWTTVNWMADALPSIELPVSSDIDPAAERLIAAGINHRRGGLPWFMAAAGHLGQASGMARLFLQHVEGIESGPLVLSSSAHAHFGLGIALASEGHPEEAREAFGKARGIYGQLDHHAVIAFCYLTELNDVLIPYFADNPAGREQLVQQADLALDKAGGALPLELSRHRAHLAPMYLDGRWDEARLVASTFTTHGNYALRRQVTQAIAPIAFHQGCFEEAWEHVRGLLPDGAGTAPGAAVLLDALMLQRLAVELCLATGDVGGAMDWVDANRRWLEWSNATLGRSEHELSRARLAIRQGDAGGAKMLADRAIERALTPRQPLALLNARRCLGDLLTSEGRRELARVELADALSLADAVASPFERARTLVSLAAAQEDRDRREATQMAAEARATFEALGAAPDLARADTLLAGLAPNPPEREAQLGLTNRELDVLRLAAQGLTDVEIGERLYISSRTVSQHLRSLYGKLQIRSRAAATRFAIEHDLA